MPKNDKVPTPPATVPAQLPLLPTTNPHVASELLVARS
ncbi:hypothetical protein BJ986_002951 [Phycicoccus badiiscoriae]|uniref:Uncharacterized protein n=1 Tax=Pedococcus badiiscoriae TaxID=642776 RepID=A0A852WNN0_9MICO|nr:hypothetical protein [Pedococcus badiiscoriae]